MMVRMPPPLLVALAVAAVWFYEGFWCKILGRMRHEFEVVEAVPFLTPALASAFLRLLGAVECALGAWVLTGWQPWWAAIAQTALLVALNSSGIFWSRHLIADPAGMVVKNFAFLLLAWVSAAQSAAPA
jgi:hypothetical protein